MLGDQVREMLSRKRHLPASPAFERCTHTSIDLGPFLSACFVRQCDTARFISGCAIWSTDEALDSWELLTVFCLKSCRFSNLKPLSVFSDYYHRSVPIISYDRDISGHIDWCLPMSYDFFVPLTIVNSDCG